MKLIKKIILCLFLCSTLISCSQNHEEEITIKFNEYGQTFIKKNYQKAINEYMYEDYFTVFPKDSLLNMLNDTYNNNIYNVNIHEFKTTNVHDLQTIDGNSYVFLNYSFKSEFVINKNIQLKKELIERVLNNADNLFGKNSAKYIESDGRFEINATRKALAIKKNNDRTWKFLIVEKHYIPYIKGILPDSIIEQF